MNPNTNSNGRVIGFDSHPDSFTSALLRGPIPAAAVVEKVFNKVPISQLTQWAKKYTTEHDTIVLEASGNSFQVVRLLASIGRRALVLESCQLGKLKEAHANNDKISAVRIGKAYLAGTAKIVWVPDLKTQQRRDLMHLHRKAVRRDVQMHNRINSYLSDHGVRLEKPSQVADDQTVLQSAAWSPREKQMLEGLLQDLHHAQQQRAHWESLIAQEVLDDPLLLSLTRLCGVRDLVAFNLGAIIGDIQRFASPKALVKYVGLNPAFDDSGEGQWHGGIGGHGRKDLRALLIQAAQALLETDHPVAKWGRKLMASKGSRNLAVAALARKLVVAVWYLMKGQWTNLEQIDAALSRKLGKIISHVGAETLKNLGHTRKHLRQTACEKLKSGRIYQLDPNKKFTPRIRPSAQSTALTQPAVQT
jgi:transposase